MVTLLWTKVREPDPSLWRKLPDWKTAELLLHRSRDSRRQSLLCWTLLEAALGPALFRVERTPGGKPFLPGGPAFSMTHCQALAALALNDVPVGVDAEPPAAFETEEAARDWIRRESWGKCRGTGPAAAPPPESPALWTGTAGGCILSICVDSGAAAPERMIEWDGKRYVL